ncbi:MAG: alpha/beta fold hydrolase [Nakamurella sp.]
MSQQSPNSPPAPAAASERATVRIGWTDLRVAVHPGDADRAPLLMFGGIGAGLEVLGPLVQALDPAVPVIRVDVPGIGGSPLPVVPLPIPALAGLMDRLLDRLGHRQVDVLGYSWGGALAQQFALQHAARCRRLVLISSSTGALSIPGDPQVLAKLLIPRRPDHPEEAARLDDHLHDDLAAVLSSGLGSIGSGGWGYLQQLTALMTWTSLPFLPLIGQPTLVVNGVDDPIVPVANGRLLAACIPRAMLTVIPGGHFEIIHSAASLGALVSRFLN